MRDGTKCCVECVGSWGRGTRKDIVAYIRIYLLCNRNRNGILPKISYLNLQIKALVVEVIVDEIKLAADID